MGTIEQNFWRKKSLNEMSETEWEALCDCCGKCCYIRFFDEENHLLCSTRVACNYLNLKTGKCVCYENRFSVSEKCNKLQKSHIKILRFFPQTCSYRLVSENKPLPEWHPLVCGNHENVPHIMDSVHEKDIKDFHDYVIERVSY